MEYKSLYKGVVGKVILTRNSELLTGLWFTTTRSQKLRIVDEQQVNNGLEIL